MKDRAKYFQFALFAVVILSLMALSYAAASKWPEAVGMLFKNYSGLLIGMSAGLFGAAFSMLIQSQRRVSAGSLEDLDLAGEWHTLVIRGLFGVGAATILYFFFDSGLVGGAIWPKLNEIGFAKVGGEPSYRVPNKSLCLLVVWSFIAGFSETFVPNILVRTESRGTESTPSR